MTKIVYVTGCLGFIGSYVTRACLNKGWYVRGIDKITYAANPKLLEEFNKYDRFTFEEIDINDIEFLYDCDYVINTAAETHVGNSISKSEDFIRSNIDGVHHILELFRNYRQETAQTPVFLHFSTDEVYGDIIDGAHTEKDLLKPSNPYSATKAAADMLILAWARTYKIPYLIVRPTNNYGIGQYVEKLIPKTIKYLNVHRKIPLHNNGSPIRNWLHAEDTASAITWLIETGLSNEIFNISGNLEQTNLVTVTKILQTYFQDDNIDIAKYIDFGLTRNGQDVRYALDDSKLKATGWSATKQFNDELPNIIKFYQHHFIW